MLGWVCCVCFDYNIMLRNDDKCMEQNRRSVAHSCPFLLYELHHPTLLRFSFSFLPVTLHHTCMYILHFHLLLRILSRSFTIFFGLFPPYLFFSFLHPPSLLTFGNHSSILIFIWFFFSLSCSVWCSVVTFASSSFQHHYFWRLFSSMESKVRGPSLSSNYPLIILPDILMLIAHLVYLFFRVYVCLFVCLLFVGMH